MEPMDIINNTSFLEISDCFIAIRNTESPVEIERMERFASEGNNLARSFLTLVHYFGLGCAKDKAQGRAIAANVISWLSESCSLEFHDAFPYIQYIFAIFNSVGIAMEKNVNVARVFFTKAAEQNYIPAVRALASRYGGEDDYGFEHNYPLAMKLLRQCVDANYSPALLRMGRCYMKGSHGVRRDETEAVRFFRLAADAGCSESMFELARCYKHGDGGLTASRDEYIRLLTLSADGHYPMAQYTIGNANENFDPPLAMSYYQKAADQGHKRSQLKLANIYMSGEDGIDEDYDKAYALVLSAYSAYGSKPKVSNSSYSKACLMMGWCYLNGFGCKLNEDKAMLYYEQAIDQKNEDCPRIAFDHEHKLLAVASVKCRPKIIKHLINKNQLGPHKLLTSEAHRGFIQAVAELGIDLGQVYSRDLVVPQHQLPRILADILLQHDTFVDSHLQFVFQQVLITGGEDGVLLQQFRAYLENGIQQLFVRRNGSSSLFIYFPQELWSKEANLRMKQMDMAVVLIDLDMKIKNQGYGGSVATLEELQADAAAITTTSEGS